jgi:hypothetical protein
MSEIHYLHGKTWRLLSMVLIAIMILSLFSPISINKAYAVDIPQPAYPDNGAITTAYTDPPLGVPSFSWSSVIGATLYRLQVDDNSDLSSPIINITTVNTTYTPDSINFLFQDDIWLFWHVRVESPKPVGEWSTTFSFSKKWAMDDNNPLLVSPDEGDSLAFFNSPDFSWTPVKGASKYRFQIASEQDSFLTPVISVDTLATTYQPNTRLGNGQYFWRVVPMDTANHLGTPSETRSFYLAFGTGDMVPDLLEPGDGSHPTFTPTFRWTAVEGAEKYRLEYTSDENCDYSVGIVINTRQPTYTPTDTFPNDKWYCWHVRVESGIAAGDWTDTWKFQKRWYLQPELLTPTNLYQTNVYPLYSWTPVPGAASYNIEVSNYKNMSQASKLASLANTMYSPGYYESPNYYYWRVTPVDGGGELGLASDVFEFQDIYTSVAPVLIYPFYYYQPNNYGEYTMEPYEDRTAPFPVFQWHRVLAPSETGGILANAYRIQVDDYPPNFETPVWQHDTENTSASSTGNVNDVFTPNIGQDYWWRVCPLDSIDGDCLINANTGFEWWSQIWRAHFDPTLALQPTPGGAPPELLRPVHGQELVEATPLLEWRPLQDATKYQVEISRDESFGSSEISKTVNIPVYAPDYSIAQRSLGRTDFGTFYWHVRGFAAGSWGAWSDVWRFQIAAQSEWRYLRTRGNEINRLLIGDDQAGDTLDPTYDLSSLYASQSQPDWFFGFTATLTGPDMTYVLYIDLDHVDDSGAPSAPPFRYYGVTTIPAHYPEYAIYVDKFNDQVGAYTTWVFTWNEINGEWDYGQRFTSIGGEVYTSTNYIELQVPNGAIGMSDVTGSASVILFSVDPVSGQVKDSVPSDQQAPGSGHLSRFSAVSNHLNLVFPPNTTGGDPTTTPSVFPFFWDWPIGSNPSDPWAGAVLEVHLDPKYTNRVAYAPMISSNAYFGPGRIALGDDIVGDNTYYWRIRSRYKLTGEPEAFGVWTGGWSFSREGFTAKNLQTSVTWATPTFSWDMVEGASTYKLQVSTDPYFGSAIINQITPLNIFTPIATLAQGKYYWRVQVNRIGISGNDWSPAEEFTLTYNSPTGLVPDGDTVDNTPTFCWIPVQNAWKYRLQVTQDPSFNSIYETIDTFNSCWTPTKGYKDGRYYWHVAIIDGNNRLGSYSIAATFAKEYRTPALVSPVNGCLTSVPTFSWDLVNGAATYRFESSLFSNFSPLYDSTTTINTQFTPLKVYAMDHLYYWRVAIRDQNGNQGPFSTRMFSLGTCKYNLPIILK